ncbi:MAG: chemotaxis protein CheW [Halobacteria archaeon]|nr:chemotaxis protein CheW [Halobacteria archaeon]
MNSNREEEKPHTQKQGQKQGQEQGQGQGQGQEQKQVLEFGIGDERYCVEIDDIAEIVNLDEITRVPDTPSHIEGVMDLRGETTRIINLGEILDTQMEDGERVVVFETADEPVGWMVDDVYEVFGISDDDIDKSMADDSVKAVVKQENGFVIWLNQGFINS